MKTVIKIQKAATYPKAGTMMQLIDSKTETRLPVKILVAKNKTGKIEFFAEEVSKENGIGFLTRGQEEAAGIFEDYFAQKMTCEVYLVSYESSRQVTFIAELDYESCESKQIQVDTSVFDEICKKIIAQGIATREELERNINVCAETLAMIFHMPEEYLKLQRGQDDFDMT